MNSSLIISRDLAKARMDLDDALSALSVTWTADDHTAIGRLTNASEALMRAVSSVALAVERLAEVVVDD
jgi:hypothetical protein